MKYDAIIIGAGIGGATTGYALAKSGMRVLFLEKGLSGLLEHDRIQGVFAETELSTQRSMKTVLKQAGRSIRKIQDNSPLIAKSFVPFIGEGGGGSSALYGAVLERFFEGDFAAQNRQTDRQKPQMSEWPVSYAEMAPYYQKAENLYGVTKRGEKQCSKANRKVWRQLEANGLHPYVLPTATDNRKQCIDNCQSYLCQYGCKNDSEKVCLKPAIEQFEATLWDDCQVLKIEESNGRINKVICRHGTTLKEATADIFILAAGALATPALLFASSSSQYPNGLANSSGLVGRYLMRHYIDLFAVELSGCSISQESQKQIGFNDFYLTPQGKFGTVQSFGLMPPVEVVIHELAASVPFANSALLHLLKRLQAVITRIYEKQFADKLIFASIMEDTPVYQNRVQIKNHMLSLTYKISKEDSKKIKYFRKKVKQAFFPLKVSLMKQAGNNKRIAHACGTCRFGEDPSWSVLNRFNQTHDIDNLFITDASFFPTSGGINPSLTIAANALRVSDYLVKDWNMKGRS